jgi:DNA-binding XRE family transcriptional regulator
MTRRAEVNSISYKIMQRRREIGISQAQLAQKLGLSRQCICQYETRRTPPPEQMADIARALNCHVAALEGSRAVAERREVTRTKQRALIGESVRRMHSARNREKIVELVQDIPEELYKPVIALLRSATRISEHKREA